MIKTDVIVLGSGIAALTLSLLLKRMEIDHVVLDRVKKQKVMPLAETLPPSALTLLENLDLLSLFEKSALRKTYGYHAMWGAEQLQTMHFFTHNPYKYGLKINKQDIRNVLLEKTMDALVTYNQLDKITCNETGFSVEICSGKEKQYIEGKQMIDATGRNRALLHALEIPIHSYDSIMAFSCHQPRFEHPNLVHDVYTESFEDGWGIVSGLNESQQVMSLFTHKNTALHKSLKDYSHWKSILSNTIYLKDFLGQETPSIIAGGNANSSAPENFSGANWLAIGDAAMAFDPLSSHGITNAIYTAKKAADAISGSLAFKDYHHNLNEIYKTYLKTKNSLYQREQRWPESAFWKYFHNENIMEPL